MVRTAQAAEVSSTTSIPGPCSGPQTTPAILEYQPAEKIRECACIVSKIAKCAHFVAYCANIVTYVYVIICAFPNSAPPIVGLHCVVQHANN